MSRASEILEVEDLPWAILLPSLSSKPVLKKMFLELVVEKYEAEVEFQFRDPKAFLESLPPPKKEEIPLPFEIQEEGDWTFKSHIEDAVKDAIIKVAQDEDNLPVMAGLKEESLHHMFFDPVAEYMEALISPNAPALILRKGQIHQEWSPLMVTSVLKDHQKNTPWLSLTATQCSYPFSYCLTGCIGIIVSPRTSEISRLD